MGGWSGTPDDQIQMYRCGNVVVPGCGKILTEAQRQRTGYCPRCGSRGATAYYPRTRWQLFKAYVKTFLTGELWSKSTQKN